MVLPLLEEELGGVGVTRAVVGCLVAHLVVSRFKNRLPGGAGAPMAVLLLSLRLLSALLMLEGVIGALVLPAVWVPIQSSKPNELVSHGWSLAHVPVPGADASISVAVFEPAGLGSSALLDRPMTLVFMCPNGVSYEPLASFLSAYASDVGAARVIAMNYRGVGRSEGSARGMGDLVADGEAVIRFALDRFELEPRDIVVHGWSLGGGVALAQRRTWPALMVVHDRSFRSLSAAGASMLGDPLASGAIGLFVGFVVSFILSPDMETLRVTSRFTCAALGIAFAAGMLKPLVPVALGLSGWDIDVAHPDLLYRGPLLAVYHRGDQMIDYETSALHPLLDLTHPMVQEVELNAKFANAAGAHMHLIKTHPAAWAQFLQAVQTQFNTNV